MARPLRRALGAAALVAFAAFAAAGLAGACNPGAYDDYDLDTNGAASGPGGPAAECNGFYSNDPSCQNCFADSGCCLEAANCDEDCKDFIRCQNGCGATETACRDACDQRFSFASSEVERLLECIGVACSQCAGLQSDGGSIGALPPGSGGAGGNGGGNGQRCEAENACSVYVACRDCDQDGTSSCETDTSGSRQNCGSCGHDCLFSSCVEGQCLPASAASNASLAQRLVAGGGYLYWASEKGNINGLKGDAIYRVKVDGNGQIEPAFEPASELTIYDLAADDTGFYFVTNVGVWTRQHVSQQPAVTIAPVTGTGLDSPGGPYRATVSANSGEVFFTAPPEGGVEGTDLWRLPKSGGAAPTKLATFTSNTISRIIADEGGVYVGSADSERDPGVWYAPLGGGKNNLFGTAAIGFAIGGDDMLVAATDDGYREQLVTLPKAGGNSQLLAGPTLSTSLRALAADASGLYYLSEESSGGTVALMRARREAGASAPSAPVVLVSDIPGANTDLTLALDETAVYGASQYNTAIWRVAK